MFVFNKIIFYLILGELFSDLSVIKIDNIETIRNYNMNSNHTIKAVAAQTGLSPHLIRIWERRYKAVEPKRTDSNRRVYSDSDINRLMLLKKATLLGESIGQIANLSEKELIAIIQKGTQTIENSNVTSLPTSTESADFHLQQCLSAIKNFDGSLLESRLLNASVSLGQPNLLENVVRPLLFKIGEMWADGEIKIAHEHLTSSIIRTLLGTMLLSNRTDDAAPRVVVATLRNQLHEFGALMAAISSISCGYRAIYLGGDMPSEDIAHAASESKVKAIAISIVYPPDDPNVHLELKKLRQFVGPDMNLIIGGNAAINYRKTIDEISAKLVNNIAEFNDTLTRLRSH